MDALVVFSNVLAQAPSSLNIPTAYGILLLCSVLASFLSGINCLQTIVYYRLYPGDRISLKALVRSYNELSALSLTEIDKVAGTWFLDVVHTGFIWAGIWFYFIQSFGNIGAINIVGIFFPGVTLSSSITMMIVHCFHIRGIFLLSGRNYWLAAPIFFLAVCRFGGSLAATVELIRLRNFLAFKITFKAFVTIGLPLSSAIDLWIMTSKLVLLQKSRHQLAREGVRVRIGTKNVIDQLILYTLEVGTLTAFAIVLCTISWFASPHTLLFLGVFFFIPKLYTNSLMGSLNIRHRLRSMTDDQTAEFTTVPNLSVVPDSLTNSSKSN